MALTDQSKVENYIGRSLTTKEQNNLSLYISAVTKHIEKLLGFTIEGNTPSTLIVEAQQGKYLFLGGIVRTITAVQLLDDEGGVAQTLTAGTEYIAHPLGSSQKRYLELVGGAYPNWAAKYPTWGKGQQVKISGIFSWDENAPDDLKLCATIWVAELLQNTSNLKSESIEGYSRVFADTEREHPEIMMTLRTYGYGLPRI